MKRALLLIAALTSCSPAPLPAACISWPEARADAEAHGWNFASLPPDHATNFLRAYDALPPASHTDADTVWIGRLEGTDHRLIAMTKGACVVTVDDASAVVLDNLVGGI